MIWSDEIGSVWVFHPLHPISEHSGVQRRPIFRHSLVSVIPARITPPLIIHHFELSPVLLAIPDCVLHVLCKVNSLLLLRFLLALLVPIASYFTSIIITSIICKQTLTFGENQRNKFFFQVPDAEDVKQDLRIRCFSGKDCWFWGKYLSRRRSRIIMVPAETAIAVAKTRPWELNILKNRM